MLSVNRNGVRQQRIFQVWILRRHVLLLYRSAVFLGCIVQRFPKCSDKAMTKEINQICLEARKQLNKKGTRGQSICYGIMSLFCLDYAMKRDANLTISSLVTVFRRLNLKMKQRIDKGRKIGVWFRTSTKKCKAGA